MNGIKQFESNWPICSFYLPQTELFTKLQYLLKKDFLKSQKKVFFSFFLFFTLGYLPFSLFLFFFLLYFLFLNLFLMIPFHKLKLNMCCAWWNQLLHFAQKFKEAIISVRGVEDKIPKFYFEWVTYILKWGSRLLPRIFINILKP